MWQCALLGVARAEPAAWPWQTIRKLVEAANWVVGGTRTTGSAPAKCLYVGWHLLLSCVGCLNFLWLCWCMPGNVCLASDNMMFRLVPARSALAALVMFNLVNVCSRSVH